MLTRLNSEKKVEMGRIGGIYEPGKMIEHFHDYRGGDNSRYCLWKMGDDSMAVVNKRDWKIKNKISMFWTHGGNGKEWENRNPKSCMPVASCVNKQGTKIMASSMAGPNEHILHFYDEALHVDKSVSHICKSVLPDLNRCSAIEISSNGRVCYLGGLSQSGKTRIVAVQNNGEFAKITSYDLMDRSYGKIRKIYRVRGYEILLLAGKNHIVVLEFRNSQFTRLGLLEDVHSGEICDICMHNSVVYSKGYNDNSITCTYLNLGSQGAQNTETFSPAKSKTNGNSPSGLLPLTESVRISRDASPRDYQNVTESRIELTTPLGNEKVALSKSGNNMYVGGSNGLHVYNRKKGTQDYYCYKSDDNKTKRIFSIFPTNSRHVVV